MADAATLQTNLAALEAALARGLRRARMPDGSEVEYADLAPTIDRLRRELAEAQGAAPAPVTFATWCRD